MNAEQIVREYYEAINAHDTIRAASYLTEDFVENFPNTPPITKQQSIDHNRGFFQAFSDFHFAIEDLTVQGNQVTVILRVTGTHDGVLPGTPPLPPTGKKFSVPDKLIITMKGDRLAAIRFESPADGGPAQAFKQLGIQPSA